MLTRIANLLGFEKRTATPNTSDSDPFIPINWGRANTFGTYASPRAVLSNFAVAARCVAIRAELSASVPLKMYRRLPNGDRERVTDHPLARVLSDLANPLQTALEVRERISRDLDLHGNHFSRVERNGEGQVTAIWPLEYGRVAVERLENGRLRYRYSGDSGPVVLLLEDVLHVRGPGDNLLGQSPISIARGSFELALTLNDAAMNNAANGFRPAGIIMHPGRLSPTAKSNIRKSVEEESGGVRNISRPAVFEEGMKWQSLSWSNSDAELLASRAMSNSDVAYAFNLSPSILGLNESVSYGSAQQAAQDLITNALAPLCSRIEQALARCLLTERGRQTYILEHDLNGLLRSDPVSQMTQFRTARDAGIMSANECRRLLNLPAVDGGDDHTPLRSAPQPAADPIASTKT